MISGTIPLKSHGGGMAIKWRLAAVMADRELDYKEVAELTGFHKVTVNKHKNLKRMPPRLDYETLDKYCRVLKCEPGDLLRYLPDEEEEDTPDVPSSV